ncbi:MAG: nucleotidyltransferase domain-containing protein, partial [Patescibacteria group bacterium]
MKKEEKICIYQNEDGKLYMPDSEVNIQKRYQTTVDDVLNFFKKLNNKNIYSVYLRGSIVFGLGIKNISDIDFFIVTLRPLTDFDRLT